MAKKFKLAKLWKNKERFKLLLIAILISAGLISLIFVTQKASSRVDSEAYTCARAGQITTRNLPCCPGFTPRNVYGQWRCRGSECEEEERECDGETAEKICRFGLWITKQCPDNQKCRDGGIMGKFCTPGFGNPPPPKLSPKPSSKPSPSFKPSPYSGSCTKTCVPSLLECTDNDGVRVSGTCSYGKVCCFYPL